MKLYIKEYSSYRSDGDAVDIKKELKQKYKYDTRRQDAFIHLAVYGAKLLQDKIEINADDELYVTTGVGNIEVVQKTLISMHNDNQSIRLFDFLNSVGNTTSYYIAGSIGLTGKNIFQISNSFTYINSLISLYASIGNSGKDAILCAIDFAGLSDDILKRVLGVDRDTKLVDSVNYQKFSLDSDSAIAELEFEARSFSIDEIKDLILKSDTELLASQRCIDLECEKDSKFFETVACYTVNNSIRKSQDLIYIDCYEDRYKILKLKSLR